jgi:hypothetical protein
MNMLIRFKKQVRIKVAGLLIFAGLLIASYGIFPTVKAQTGPDWGMTFNWHQGQAEVTMVPEATHVCVLTRVTGSFKGGGEWVRVEADDDGNWRLRGASQQEDVAASATCFAKSAFLATGPYKEVSPPFVAIDKKSDCPGNYQETWWGDAATYLSGVKGDFGGGGERARVNQSSGAFTNSAVWAESCRGSLEARAYAFFAGSPGSGIIAKFLGGEYALTQHPSDAESQEIKMAPAGDAMCYLTKIEGLFDGGGEVVRIYPKAVGGVEYWHLYVHSGKSGGGDRKWISAKARCYKRDQR